MRHRRNISKFNSDELLRIMLRASGAQKANSPMLFISMRNPFIMIFKSPWPMCSSFQTIRFFCYQHNKKQTKREFVFSQKHKNNKLLSCFLQKQTLSGTNNKTLCRKRTTSLGNVLSVFHALLHFLCFYRVCCDSPKVLYDFC